MALKYSYSDILNEAYKKIADELRQAADDDSKLEEFIKKYNLFEDEDEYYYDTKRGKILIIGELSFSKDILYAIAKKEFNIPKDRIDFKDYQEAKHYDFKKLKGYSEYIDIVIGPNAHKEKGIGNYNSVISMIQTEQDKYPHLSLAQDSTGRLKFTKTSLKNVLNETRLVKLLA